MYRLATWTLGLLLVDQATRSIAEHRVHEAIHLLPEFGVRYTTNPTFWSWPGAPEAWVLPLHLATLPLTILVVSWGVRYRRVYRASALVDAALALFLLAALGNLLDRLMLGHVRDWLMTPIAVANLADIAVWPALAFLAAELWAYPPARGILSLDPRRWWQPSP